MVRQLQDREGGGTIFRAHQRQDIDDLLDGVGHDEVFHMPLYSLPKSTELYEDFRALDLLFVCDGHLKLSDGRYG